MAASLDQAAGQIATSPVVPPQLSLAPGPSAAGGAEIDGWKAAGVVLQIVGLLLGGKGGSGGGGGSGGFR